MIDLKLQDEEAAAIESLLDLLLTNKAAADAVFADGAQRRAVKRVSLKLHWSRGGA